MEHVHRFLRTAQYLLPGSCWNSSQTARHWGSTGLRCFPQELLIEKKCGFGRLEGLKGTHLDLVGCMEHLKHFLPFSAPGQGQPYHDSVRFTSIIPCARRGPVRRAENLAGPAEQDWQITSLGACGALVYCASSEKRWFLKITPHRF